MKKHLIVVSLASLFLCQSAVAQDQPKPVDRETFHSSLLGLLAGGILGGPPGAVIGYASGAVIGDLESKNRQLEESSQALADNQTSQDHLSDQAQQHQVNFQQQKSGELDQLAALKEGFRFCLGFRTGSSLIEPKMAEQLDALAKMLNAFPQFKLLIEAGADQRGSEAFNHELSRARADAVAKLLIDAGLPRNRLSTRYQGESAAEYPMNDLEGLAFDRMVQLTLLHGESS
ncbi:MAG: OmpA family protein [Candidatus Thiodiazotropha sp. 6PLUC2]